MSARYRPNHGDLVGGKSDISDKELAEAIKAKPGAALNAAVLAAIDSVFIPSQQRENVKKGSAGNNNKLRGMCLGAINNRRGFAVSSVSWSRQNLIKLLAFWVHKAFPKFEYTSIQVWSVTV